jgi:hypothetical protein
VTAAIAAARADLGEVLGPRGVDEVLAALEHEAALLLADRRAAGVVSWALTEADPVRDPDSRGS